MSQNARPVVLIADKLAQSTVDALGDSVEVRWVDGPNRAELLAAVGDAAVSYTHLTLPTTPYV